MSQPAIAISSPTAPPASDPPFVAPAKSFVKHAKLIGGLTFASRLFGLAREAVAGHYLGTGLVASAFTVAFTIPNLFRKLFGEGALSAAFIPLYAQAIKHEHADHANDFAAASVNLLVAMLLGITIVGEAALAAALWLWPNLREDTALTLKLTMVMLPYVLLICGGALLGGVLQVHRRFGAPAFAPILLNVIHIGVVFLGAHLIGLHGKDAASPAVVLKQTTLAYWLGFFVLVAGAAQVAVLLPGLRATGFRLRLVPHFWTPQVKRMLRLTVPVAFGAGVLQLSVLLDKGISVALMQGVDAAGRPSTSFTLLGHAMRYPMELGAPARLNLAQFLYQFPLGVFAIALATALFPGLSAEALDKDRANFRAVLRHGIEATLWEGLPASIGLILVAEPAARLLFQHGQIGSHSALLVARSTMWYAGAIWAFSMLQILNRAYYALHDTATPLAMSVANIGINLVVEIPLLWVPRLGESAMAVGTLVSFAVQAIVTLWMLDRRLGGLQLSTLAKPAGKMLLAAAAMTAACVAVRFMPGYPRGVGRLAWAGQLILQMGVGAGVYIGVCFALGVTIMDDVLPLRKWKVRR